MINTLAIAVTKEVYIRDIVLKNIKVPKVLHNNEPRIDIKKAYWIIHSVDILFTQETIKDLFDYVTLDLKPTEGALLAYYEFGNSINCRNDYKSFGMNIIKNRLTIFHYNGDNMINEISI